MTEWQQLNIRSKLAMCLTADPSDTLQVRTLDVMLIMGKGYQQEDLEKYREWLAKGEESEYRAALGSLRDTYLPKELPSNYYADPILLDGIATLSYPQQINCAINLIARLEWADEMAAKMYENSLYPENMKKLMKEAEQMISACRSLLIRLGVNPDTTEI